MLYDRYGQFRFADGCCYGYGQVLLLQRAISLVPSARAGPQTQVEFTPDLRYDDSDEAWGVRGRTLDPDKYVRGDQGPVPNTAYKPDDGRGKAVPELVLTPDTLAYYKKLDDKRKEIADDAHAEVAECEFELGHSLRVTWILAQRADKALMPMLAAKELDDGYRIAKDGLLERLVNLPPPANATWVPIVPEGQATGNLPWKRWLFLQCHVGVLGAHRNADKTCALLSRQV